MAGPENIQSILANLLGDNPQAQDLPALEVVLQSDPIAIDEYLDHAMLHGLLERELGGSLPNLIHPAGWSSNFERPKNLLVLPRSMPLSFWLASLTTIAAIFAFITMFVRVSDPTKQSPAIGVDRTIAEEGFEHALAIDKKFSLTGWFGDEVDIVGEWMGVEPLRGEHMLRMLTSTEFGENACDIYRVIDLRALPIDEAIPNWIEASMAFNSVSPVVEDTYVFGIHLYSYDFSSMDSQTEIPPIATDAIGFVGRQITADSDTDTWQHLDTKLDVPDGSKFVVLHISVRDSKGKQTPFPGQFIDEVQLRLTSL